MSKPRRRPVASDRQFRINRPEYSADHGTPERWQHSGRTLEITERAGILATRVTEEHLVDILFLRRAITPSEREAALKFKLDYQRAGLEARLTSRYTPIARARDFFANIPDRNDFEEAAYQRWRNAVRALGKLLADTLITVVCHDHHPTADTLPQLQDGLKKLVDWYGLDIDRPPVSGENVQQAAAR